MTEQRGAAAVTPGGTVGRAVAEAAARLAAAGAEPAADEAWLLMGHILGVRGLKGRLAREQRLTVPAAERFEELVAARARREPLQYLLGDTEFMGLRFQCRPGVLVPRPETEVLVEAVTARVQTWPQFVAADVGCGTGVIACSLAALLPQAHVFAIDPAPAAIELTTQNALDLGLGDRVETRPGRHLEPLTADEKGRLNCVVANPPYIPTRELDGLAPEVQREPRGALDGGPDGLGFFRALTPELAHAGDGRLLVGLEVGRGQAGEVADMLRRIPRRPAVEVVEDYQGIQRVVLALLEAPSQSCAHTHSR